MGGLLRCTACGEVEWNLRAQIEGDGAPVQRCRVCGEELRPERRRPGRRLAAPVAVERRDARPSAMR